MGNVEPYLAVIRPALLAGQTAEAFWISRHGRPLAAKSLAERVYYRSGLGFGRPFGPHSFRHALSTTAVLRAPGEPGLAAALLGISPAVIEQHYNLAGQVAATTSFARLIAADRKRHASSRPPAPPSAPSGHRPATGPGRPRGRPPRQARPPHEGV